MKKNSAKRIERRNEEIANRTLYIVSRMFTRADGGVSVQINVNLTDGGLILKVATIFHRIFFIFSSSAIFIDFECLSL